MNEVGYFEFETKIRKMLLDMVEPVQKRLLDDRDKIVKLRTDLEANKRKTEDLEFSLHKTDGRLVAFDDIYKKINKVEGEARMETVRIDNEFERLKSDLEM
jgi:SMC interacting uncharacterized protein involved in chromosome segregation